LIWPAPEAVTLTVFCGASALELPVRARNRKEKPPVFAPAEAAPAVELRTISKPFNRRELTRDQATGEVRLSIVDDFGRSTIVEHGLTTWSCGRENYRILPGDPLSAHQECHWTEEVSRGDWSVRTETRSTMTATLTHWHISGQLEAYENNLLVLERHWDKKVLRHLN
jgi:hypothetical protein